jgi:hypothetical protein
MSEPDWSMYGVDIQPGDPYEPAAQEEWTLHCALGHGNDVGAATLVDLRDAIGGPWASYDMVELMLFIRAHHERFHK